MEKVAGILPSREKRYIKGESVTQESDISSRVFEENPDIFVNICSFDDASKNSYFATALK